MKICCTSLIHSAIRMVYGAYRRFSMPFRPFRSTVLFSSRLEKDVWDFLVDGKQPIILVLAREMYRKIPQELQSLLDADRLLIISTTNAVRQSKSTAQARNKYICELADDIMFIGATPQSSLYELSNQFKSKVFSL